MRTPKRVSRFRAEGSAAPIWRTRLSAQRHRDRGLSVALLLVFGGLWMQRATERALQDQLAQSIEFDDSDRRRRPRILVENELRAARGWSELPDVRNAAHRLAQHRGNEEESLAMIRRLPLKPAMLLATLEPLRDSDDYEGFGLVSRDGLVLAASDAQQVGRTLTQEGSRC